LIGPAAEFASRDRGPIRGLETANSVLGRSFDLQRPGSAGDDYRSIRDHGELIFAPDHRQVPRWAVPNSAIRT